MKLRQYLLSQNVVVLIVTVVVTACFSLLFGSLSLRLQNIPQSRSDTEKAILLRGDAIIYNETKLTDFDVKNILLDTKVGIRQTEAGGVRYDVDLDTFISAEQEYSLIKLSPYYDLSLFYRQLILFVIVIFLITFLIASIIMQHMNMKNIIGPVVRLKAETEKLSEGELDAEVADEGYGEVNELTQAVESLRLRLKETVASQERYDDNRKFLTSSISHDLKTPVTAVRGYIEGVLDSVADTPEKQSYYLTKALDKTVLITNMIDDLLLYSKLDLNQLPFDYEMVDIALYLADSVEDSRMAFAQEGKEIGLENGLAGTVFVRIDPRRFRRVVQNIVDNARKHIREGSGELKVMLRQTHAAVIVEFADNGEGIKKEDLPHIFDRFYRADSARKIEGSSGLGLAIAKQIVNGMDGRIWAVSERGRGSSIMISLRKISIMEAEEKNEKNSNR